MTELQRLRQKVGAQSEHLVQNRLVALGFRCVSRIGTPMRYVNGKWIHAEKVAGDFRALGQEGTGVLVEVKHRSADVLSLSDFEPHQLSALTDWWKAGGISLVAWVSTKGIFVMEWPLPPHLMAKGVPLTIDSARKLEIKPGMLP